MLNNIIKYKIFYIKYIFFYSCIIDPYLVSLASLRVVPNNEVYTVMGWTLQVSFLLLIPVHLIFKSVSNLFFLTLTSLSNVWIIFVETLLLTLNIPFCTSAKKLLSKVDLTELLDAKLEYFSFLGLYNRKI